MALPFTLIYGFISFRRHQTQAVPSALPAARAATSWTASLLVLLALFHSSSETSRLVVSTSLFILLALALIPRLRTKQLRRYGAASVLVIGIVSLFVIAPPGDFVNSLAQLGETARFPADLRLAIWNDSASLLSDFRWLGTGMGGFEPAFPKYQGFTSLNQIQNPHSDVLALLISWGFVGACVLLVALAGIFRQAFMGALFLQDERRRLLAVAISASLCAVLLRCSLQSTLSAPVLAVCFAWLAGIAQSSGLE
jgi:O-antigen ligase